MVSYAPPICCPSVTFTGGVVKSRELNLNVKNIFAGSHTEHHWRCSYPGPKLMNMFIKCYCSPIAWPKLKTLFIKRYCCPFPRVCYEVLSQHFVLECFPHFLNFRKRRTLPADTNVHTKMPFNYRSTIGSIVACTDICQICPNMYWYCCTWSISHLFQSHFERFHTYIT